MEATEKPELETYKNFWRINNVLDNGKKITLDLNKEIFYGKEIGSRHDGIEYSKIKQWIEYSKQSKQEGKFYTGNLLQHHLLFNSLFEIKKSNKNNKEIEKISKMLEGILRNKKLLTNSTIRYNPKGKDQIIHSKWMEDEFTEFHEITSPHEWIKDSKNSELYKKILGIDKTKDINKIYDREIYFQGLEKKPESIAEYFIYFEPFTLVSSSLTPIPPFFWDHPTGSYGTLHSLGLRLKEIK